MRESSGSSTSRARDAAATVEGARKEAERILAETQKEAERTLEQTRLRAAADVRRERDPQAEQAQSEEIRNAAERESTQMRRGAEKYAYDVLSQLEGVVGKVMTTIERGKQEMQRPELRARRAPRKGHRAVRERSVMSNGPIPPGFAYRSLRRTCKGEGPYSLFPNPLECGYLAPHSKGISG